jgi:hypothetical protein
MTNTFIDAILTENQNWTAVGSKYGQAAQEIEQMMIAGENPHTYLCDAQDRASHPESWNRGITGLKKALKPLGIVITSTRDYRITHRTRNPLFKVEWKVNVDQARKIKDAENQAEAERLEKLAVQARIDAEALADSMVTFSTMAQAIVDECTRLGIHPLNVANKIYDLVNASETVRAQ